MAVDYFSVQFELQLVGGAVRIWFMGSQKLAPFSQIVENLSMMPVVWDCCIRAHIWRNNFPGNCQE